jgi:hypothetical protein
MAVPGDTTYPVIYSLQPTIEQDQASPLRRNLYTLYFYTYFGHMFFAFQLNLGAFCLQFVDVSLNFDTLKFNWSQKSAFFRISGINLSHLGADLSILGAKKRFRDVKYPFLKKTHFFC